jgi:hypothetical protein
MLCKGTWEEMGMAGQNGILAVIFLPESDDKAREVDKPSLQTAVHRGYQPQSCKWRLPYWKWNRAGEFAVCVTSSRDTTANNINSLLLSHVEIIVEVGILWH